MMTEPVKLRRFSKIPLVTILTLGGMALSYSIAPNPAAAQEGGDANALNEEGKALFGEGKILEAYKRFKQATILSPEGKYYFNLCLSLNQLERYAEAARACEQVAPSGAEERIIGKAQGLLEQIYTKTPPPPHTPTTGTPATGSPVPEGTGVNPGTTTPSGDTGAPSPVVPSAPSRNENLEDQYKWSLGGSLGSLSNLGIGEGSFPSGSGFYGNGAHLGLFANFMYKPAQRIGFQGYFGFSTLSPSDSNNDALSVFDFGAAAYKHFAITRSIDVTPLLGIHAGLLQPDPSSEEGLLSFGLRGQVSLDWALTKEHILSFAPALNVYSGASDSTNLIAREYGLNETGMSLEFSLQYQFRFTTEFSSSPIFSLE